MILRSARVLVAALLVVGCGAPVDPFAPTARVEGLRLPFDAYTHSLAGLYAIENAKDLLTRECMEARGQTWEAIERPTNLKDLRNRRRYGVVEMGVAERVGYHAPAGLLTPLAVERRYDAREGTLTESQTAAAFGPGGCADEAATRLQPARSPDLELVDRLSRDSLDDAQQVPPVASAMGAWRECLRGMGFDYATPFAAMSDARWWADDAAEASDDAAEASGDGAGASGDGAGASGDEKAVAVADVRCKERTGLVEVWHAAEVEIQRKEIRRHPSYFEELGAATEAELAAARQVVE
ncbi:hypothetical protein ACTMTJ_26745 [Phytohabitans sp. LJ34]|uniref:hypothetical protein n=1 Tax=Phytohabitans sp. LJ34 TaxID=3452217 RepID=UPI003F8AEA96